MELAQTDWEEEIKYRNKHNLYYTEEEIFNMIQQLVRCYSLLQKCNITHRDVKPQNILILNDLFKICDFGEAMITHGKNGFIHQPIRGSELYMSPILFDALNNHKRDVIHNTYKSDVFSLGMCFLFASCLDYKCLYSVRRATDMNKLRAVIEQYVNKRYSQTFIEILLWMLNLNEKERPDFIELSAMV